MRRDEGVKKHEVTQKMEGKDNEKSKLK